MLEIAGFEVLDLGVNVSSETICEKIKEHSPDIVGLSCLLTTTLPMVEETIEEITKAGLRDRVKIIVGGSPLSAKLASDFGAHAYAENANEAVTRCRKLLGVKTNE
jgi:5-methyltetrahydrofolate--homocysteine methyltransferase